MRFGVFTNYYLENPEDFQRYQNMMEQMLLMEKYGWEYAAIGERHMYDDGFPEPLTCMIDFLAKTKKMKVLAFLLLPTYDPLRLAEIIATMDWISRGRVMFGAGLGYRPIELTAFGVSRKTRGPRFEEALTIIKRLWTERRVTFHGKYYHYNDVFVSPKPFQKPHPPIFIGGSVEASFKRAARMGDGIFPAVSGLSETREVIEKYRKALREYGKEPTEAVVIMLKDGFIAKDRETAKKILAGPYIKLIDHYRRWGNPHVTAWPEIDFEDLVKGERLFVGGPEEWIAEIERFKNAGISYFSIRFDYTGIPQDQVLDAIKLFGEKVLPYFTED